MARKTKTIPPIHPGETLREDFLKPLGMTVHRMAMELSVPATPVNDIVRGKRAITADTALRLARYFGTTPQFWMSLQANYAWNWLRTRAALRSPTGSGRAGQRDSIRAIHPDMETRTIQATRREPSAGTDSP